MGLKRTFDFFDQGLSIGERAVEHMHLAAIALAQRDENSTRRAAGADHQGIARTIRPPGGGGIEIAEKTEIVGIVAVDLSVADDQRIDRTNGLGKVIDAIAERKDRFLVRDGDITPDEFARAKAFEKGGKFGRRDVDRFIGAINAVFGEPGAVDERRARMGYGMADDEGFFGHVCSGFCGQQVWGDIAQGTDQGQERQAENCKIVAGDSLEQSN
jgi:hypothetical protein